MPPTNAKGMMLRISSARRRSETWKTATQKSGITTLEPYGSGGWSRAADSQTVHPGDAIAMRSSALRCPFLWLLFTKPTRSRPVTLAITIAEAAAHFTATSPFCGAPTGYPLAATVMPSFRYVDIGNTARQAHASAVRMIMAAAIAFDSHGTWPVATSFCNAALAIFLLPSPGRLACRAIHDHLQILHNVILHA